MSFDGLLIDTCTIQRYTEGAADAYGNKERVWADHLTDEPCRLSNLNITNTRNTGEIKVGAEVVIAENKLFLNDVDVTEQDRAVVDGVTYEVLFVGQFQDSEGNHHKEAYLRTVR